MNLARDLSTARSEAHDSDALRLQVRDLVRSIDFFARVLGFEVVDNARLAGARCVTMSKRGGRTVALHDSHCAGPSSVGSRKFVVADLEQVRARAWDFGTRVARRRDGADRPAPSRSLWIFDPDGHELELEEARPR